MNPQQKVNFVEMKYTDQNGYLDMNKTSALLNPSSTMPGRNEMAHADNGDGIELGQLQVKSFYK